MTLEIFECPGCFSDLRIPPRAALGNLSATLQEMPEFQGLELRCRFCGTAFRLPPEHHEIDRRKELNDLIDQLGKEILEGRNRPDSPHE